VPHGGAGLYRYAPEATSAPHDEIIGMVVTIGFSHHESEGDGFVNQGSFPEIALVINRFPTRVGSFPGRASQRGEMPQREAPLVVLMDGSRSLRK
jgi:hypothetical protein